MKAYSDVYIKTFYGYVERPTARKGVGSTDGQSAGNPEHTRLPIKAEPNSVRTLYHNGIKIRDRYYDEDGYAKKDIDYTDHGNPKEHPKVPHEHTWDWSDPNKPKRSAADD